MSSLSIDLRVQRGETFALQAAAEVPLSGITGLYGASGSGKTSLLSAIAGLLPATGSLRLGDLAWQDGSVNLPTHRRSVGYVFQDSRLFPHLDVRGNLQYAWQRRRGDNGPTPECAMAWFDLAPLAGQRPHQLSRGQQQRAALARALVSAPDLLLLDEPLANIDQSARRAIVSRLRQLPRERELAMLYVSHDMAELSQLADWLLVLSDGGIAAQGPLLELSADLELALAHEEQAAAIVEARIVDHDERYGLTELRFADQPLFVSGIDQAAGTAMRLRLPARDISLCRVKPEQTSILNVLSARIDAIESGQRSQLLVRLKVADQFLLARVTRKSLEALALEVGDAVYAQVKSVALLQDTRVERHA